jgi:hypothetical protein
VLVELFVNMQQSKIDRFYAPSRCGGIRTGGSGGDGVPSDDDAPMIPKGFCVTSASDSRVYHSAKRSKFEDEAEECSDVDDASTSASDSFVVSDHDSECSSNARSPNAQHELHEICSSLRNRRRFVHCPQCLRLVRAVLQFVAAVQESMAGS